MGNIDIEAHLAQELAADDPWRLEGNPFESRRYEAMLRLIRSRGRIDRALEVGCAAGAFTERLVPHCDDLHVIDIQPQAIDRARRRLGDGAKVTWAVASADADSASEPYDLIVVAE